MDMADILNDCNCAGFEGLAFPIDLRRIRNRQDRQAARKAFADGVHWQRRERISLQRLRGCR